MSTMESSARANATHLVVFQHGLLGSEADFANMQLQFTRHLAATDRVYAHIATCNATSFSTMFATCDGIDCGAERLASEIVRVTSTMPNVTTFSIVGHSMGGLYARYCIGILYARGFFDTIEPMNFITLATPHLGSRRPQRGSINLIYNAIAPRLFDRTGRQFALVDQATEQTIALSRPASGKYPHRASYAACEDVKGPLSVCLQQKPLRGLEPLDFTTYYCELHDQQLSFHEQLLDESEPSRTTGTTKHTGNCVVQIDLRQAETTVVLPAKDTGSTDWYVVVSLPQSNTTDQYHPACTLRLSHSELASHWKWIPALSNATAGVHCETTRGSSTAGGPHPPPLLSCLARGQFLQALQLFRVRTLYATVFNDHTVPYSCAAIRTFNPYRASVDEPQSSTRAAAALVTSPFYDHIVQQSLWQAPLLRDTLPLEAKVNATRKSTANFLFVKELATREAVSDKSVEVNAASNSSTSSISTIPSGSASGSPPSSSSSSPPSSSISSSSCASPAASYSSLLSAYFSTPSATNRTQPSTTTTAPPPPPPATAPAPLALPVVRRAPFRDRHLLVDRVDDAFATDDARDTLRGMLLSLQSVGWRRLDVKIDSLLAHEMVIAKRADPTATAGSFGESGLDIIHHVMDTFVL